MGYISQQPLDQVNGDDSLNYCPSSPQMANTFASQLQEYSEERDNIKSGVTSPEVAGRVSLINDTCPSPLDEDETWEVTRMPVQK